MTKNLIAVAVTGLTLSIAPVVYAASSCAGVTIDTRGQTNRPARGIGPVPSAVPGHKGAFPIELKLRPNLATIRSDGVTVLVYEMKNIGPKSLPMPTQKEEGSWAARNAGRPFDLLILTLYVSSPNGPNPFVTLYQQPTPPEPPPNILRLLEGTATLSGRLGFEQTVCSLPPGATMRVITNVKLPTEASRTMQGQAELLRETFGQMITSATVGTATSKPLR